MADSTPYLSAVIENDVVEKEIGEIVFDENFATLDELDLASLTVDDLAALKDTVFRSAMIGIATQPEISLQVSHQNGTHASHSDHVTHQKSSDVPPMEGGN